MPPTQNQLQLADPPHGALMSQPALIGVFLRRLGPDDLDSAKSRDKDGCNGVPMVFVVFSKDSWGL